ncbi:hypothetical protein MAR_030965 [Mya arenaria]|nr:hypothetical protein MAR_030965 [Mya arenaria]
MYRHFS